jgi:hypothetical protein
VTSHNNRGAVFCAWSVPKVYRRQRRSFGRSRFSVVFLDPTANAELVPTLHVALHTSHAALPMVTSKFCPNIALPTLAPILLMQPLQRHIYYIYIYYKIPIICVTYTRRTSGHCLGTFKTGDIVYCPPPPQCSISHYLPPTFFLFSLSLRLE